MSMNGYIARCMAIAGMFVLASAVTDAKAGPVAFGPTPYAQRSDSPFASTTFSYFYVENFEDHALNTPGVTASSGQAATIQFGTPSGHDSVDEDDGAVDGVVSSGDSFYTLGVPGLGFTFQPTALGGRLPTHAGIVWTDGYGEITFQAFGPGNKLLASIGPVSEAGVFPDDTVFPQVAEDRFFGISDEGGIERIFISNTVGGIEVDHLQYGRVPSSPTAIPLPAGAWTGMGLMAAMGLESVRRSWKKGTLRIAA